MKKKKLKKLYNELLDQYVDMEERADDFHSKYFSAIRETGSLKKDILNKHIQCSNMADKLAELREAADFEARVAARLATLPLLRCDSECPWNKMDPKNSLDCIHEYEKRFCRLRAARIAVEEEMDRWEKN